MKNFQPQRSTSGLLKRGSKGAMSEMSRSMMDLSVHDKDANDVPVPRFKASVSVWSFSVYVLVKKE